MVGKSQEILLQLQITPQEILLQLQIIFDSSRLESSHSLVPLGGSFPSPCPWAILLFLVLNIYRFLSEKK